MTVFKTWLFGVVAASMAVSLLSALLPKGTISTVARCSGGLVMLLVVLRPLLAGELSATQKESYGYWEETISQQAQAYSRENLQEIERHIITQTEEYIVQQAAALGLTVAPQVRCSVRDGVPFPVAVTLDIPRDAALEARIETDLAIGRENQYWQEG